MFESSRVANNTPSLIPYPFRVKAWDLGRSHFLLSAARVGKEIDQPPVNTVSLLSGCVLIWKGVNIDVKR